jgi:hypothetical protein
MLSSEQNDEVSKSSTGRFETTGDDSSTEGGKQKNKILIDTWQKKKQHPTFLNMMRIV